MTYETMDWVAEARRVVWAFGLEEGCSFQERWTRCRFDKPPVTTYHQNLRSKYGKSLTIPALEGSFFSCTYDSAVNRGRHYLIQPTFGADSTMVEIDWNGCLLCWTMNLQSAPLLAKGLFRLGLLTPEIEAALKVNLTAHERLVWRLEIEARNEL